MARPSQDFLPLLYNLMQASLGILYSGKEILFRELGDGRSVLTLILFILLGILLAHLPQLSVMAVSRKLPLPDFFQNFFLGNNYLSPTTFIFFSTGLSSRVPLTH